MQCVLNLKKEFLSIYDRDNNALFYFFLQENKKLNKLKNGNSFSEESAGNASSFPSHSAFLFGRTSWPGMA